VAFDDPVLEMTRHGSPESGGFSLDRTLESRVRAPLTMICAAIFQAPPERVQIDHEKEVHKALLHLAGAADEGLQPEAFGPGGDADILEKLVDRLRRSGKEGEHDRREAGER